MNVGRCLKILALVLVCAMVIAPLAFGQEGGDNVPVAKSKSAWDILKAGGTIGWCIVAMSVWATALIIQYFVEIRRDKLCPPEIVGELEALVEEEQYEEAIALCEQEKTFFTNMVGAGLAKVNEGYEEMNKAAMDIGAEEAYKLNVKISWLNLLGQVAPLMGLFGTVTGMIGSFQVIEQMKTPSPAMLAKGVYEALVTTMQGLCVAIPVLGFYFFFKNKVGSTIIELGLIAGEFLERFKQAKG